MVARVAVASEFSLDTEPTTIGVSGIQFGDRNQKIQRGSFGASCTAVAWYVSPSYNGVSADVFLQFR